MNFLEPFGLFGLAAMLPVIALYFLKLKREQRVVPSTLLWKKVIEDLHVNAPFQRLKYSLLLLLQLLLIALLAFALARPFLSLAAARGQRIVLLVDTSASMGTRDAGPGGKQSRLQAAIRDAQKKIDDLGTRGEMRILAFDEEARQLTSFTNDRALLKEALGRLRPRDLRTRAQEAFETALALAEERKNTEILVLSDGCFGKLSLQKLLGEKVAAGNTEEMKDQIYRLDKFRFVNYGQAESDNVGITQINARTRLARKSIGGKKSEYLETQVFVMIENFSPEDQEVTLMLSGEAGRPYTKLVKLRGRAAAGETLSDAPAEGTTLEASRSQEVFKLPPDAAGVVTVRVRRGKGPDRFTLDDQARVVVGYAQGSKVLWVSRGNYFLEKAFAVMHGVDVTMNTPEALEKEWKARGSLAVDGYDAVVFEGWAPPRWEDGGAVFLGVLPPLPGFKKKEGPAREFPAIVDWDVAHPVMRYVNFGNIQIAEAQTWRVPKRAHTLVEASGGPLIVAYESDRVHAVATAFQVIRTDWAYRAALSLFIRNAIAWVSEVSPRRRPSAQKTGQPLVLPPVRNAPLAVLTGPGGAPLNVQLSADKKVFVKGINRVGLYRLSGLPGEGATGRAFAVNLADPDESDNRARPNLLVGMQTIKATPAAIQGKREIWRPLVLAALGLLMLEWWAYHRRLGM